jgi:hypothetical protein
MSNFRVAITVGEAFLDALLRHWGKILFVGPVASNLLDRKDLFVPEHSWNFCKVFINQRFNVSRQERFHLSVTRVVTDKDDSSTDNKTHPGLGTTIKLILSRALAAFDRQ